MKEKDIDIWELVQKDIQYDVPILIRIDYECLKLRYVNKLTYKEIGKLVHKSARRVNEIIYFAEGNLISVYVSGRDRNEYLEKKKRRKES